MKIKKGDNIIVLAGKDKGKKAKILKVFTSTGKVLVEGVAEVKKRRKAKKSNEKGQTLTISQPIDISNVAHFCQTCKKGVRREHKHDK
ncbi:MAG TPA: 50S ribosomal protein L24 [Candidatus Paceibacterota bacterium]